MTTPCLLVVDDSEADQMIHAIALRSVAPDVEIVQAWDGGEALDLLSTPPPRPTIILLDINMPGMDGFAFLEEYNKLEQKSSVVVMLSSSHQTSDQERALSYDFVTSYVVKPLDEQKIGEILAT